MSKTNSNVERSTLSFQNFDEVNAYLDRLLAQGYTKLGNWNLAQMSEHLRDWMLYPIEGYPVAPFPINFMLWCMKVTIGRSIFNKVITTGKMQVGGPTMGQTVHSANGIEDHTSVERLKEAISRFEAYTGPYHPSPLFGEFNRDNATRLQLIHCAHHLSFLKPSDDQPDALKATSLADAV